MSNKERIEKFGTDLDALNEEYKERVKKLFESVEKKEDEVKPVFPVESDYMKGRVDMLHLHSVEQAAKLGLTGYGTLPIVEWLTARAYVIEEINKANGGDNGFKYGCENNLISFNHESNELKRTDFGYLQEAESCLYIRNVDKALSLLACDMFSNSYRIMLGINND